MNHNGYITAAPIQGAPAGDPYARLAEEIIRRAQNDYQKPYCYNRNEIMEFFTSDWYKDLFDYLTLCAADFDPDEYVLPVGVVIK